jgi:hypothetical protein
MQSHKKLVIKKFNWNLLNRNWIYWMSETIPIKFSILFFFNFFYQIEQCMIKNKYKNVTFHFLIFFKNFFISDDCEKFNWKLAKFFWNKKCDLIFLEHSFHISDKKSSSIQAKSQRKIRWKLLDKCENSTPRGFHKMNIEYQFVCCMWKKLCTSWYVCTMFKENFLVAEFVAFRSFLQTRKKLNWWQKLSENYSTLFWTYFLFWFCRGDWEAKKQK